MKKSARKSKERAKGCQKISSFFTKNDNQSSSCNSPKKVTCNEPVIIIKSDNSDEESQNLLAFKSKSKDNKRKFDDQCSGESPPFKKISEHTVPSTTGIIRVSSNVHISPSRSGSTPIKIRTLINVKTPEKLLSPAVLRKCQPLSLLNVTSSPEDLGFRTGFGQKSPNKPSTSKNISSPQTPNKTKRSPKKLFEKSPKNLKDFNVEIIKNYVKITPTKSEVEDCEVIQNNQKMSQNVQEQNEKTPTKTKSSPTHHSPKTAAKTKLSFADCSLPNDNFSELKIKNDSFKEVKLSEKENTDTSNLSCSFNEDNWEVGLCDFIEYTLDLTKSQHCKIISITERSTEKIITVKSTQTNDQALCILQGFWINSKLCIGDTVHITAFKSDDKWIIDNQNGLLVFEPDLLISTTTVLNSVFCKRRTIFREKFRGFEPTNKHMIVGNMIHNLFQHVLDKKLFEHKDIEHCALEIFNSPDWIKQIFESGESKQYIAEEYFNYVPKIYEFVNTYIQKSAPSRDVKKIYNKDNWKGTISDIEDIEENIWCPDLGVKGKVDVSIKSGSSVMPLEVKTGRASGSLEHRGQVLLYTMMMTKLGYKVSSGLLLYLKEGILKEVSSTETEKRHLIILRNELAYFLSRVPSVRDDTKGRMLEPNEIPEPIDHFSCSKCPYSAVCMAYSKYSNEDISSKNTLKQVHSEIANFLTSVHIEYFMRWVALLHFEMPGRNGTKQLRDIYTLSPEERQNRGKCLINLEITKIVEESNGLWITIFQSSQQEPGNNFLLSGFVDNSYVVISINTRPAVSSGFITNISLNSVTIALDRNLHKKYSNELFFADTYDSSVFLSYNLASLALILDNTPRSSRLRNIIIDKQPATFLSKLPKMLAEKAKPILKRLNRVQQRAVLKAIAANEYFLIKGMPGTGKTATIVALIQLLVEINKSVLITSHTHTAVDNVCMKLIPFGIKFMRLGSTTKINPSLKTFSESYLTRDCTTPEALEVVYNSVQVLAVTCLAAGHPILSKRTLDVCLVDESTQVLQCSVIRPLLAAKSFILIGDPNQLPPVVRNKTAIEFDMSESLFERLCTEESCISLNLNYRMNETITSLANTLIYDGELQIGAERIAKASLTVPKLNDVIKTYKHFPWLIKALDSKLENAVQFIDTGPVWNLEKNVPWAQNRCLEEESGSQENQNCSNSFEAAIIYHLVQALITKGKVPKDQIGVIATYRIQVALLTELLKSTSIDISTVDQFQGKDKTIIIYSCSKSKDLSKPWNDNKFDLTEDRRRLNVAITRAKHKLIIVGDLATLQKYSTFKKIKDHLEKNVINLLNYPEFEWDAILDLKVY